MTFSILWFPRGCDKMKLAGWDSISWICLNTLPHYHLDYHSRPQYSLWLHQFLNCRLLKTSTKNLFDVPIDVKKIVVFYCCNNWTAQYHSAIFCSFFNVAILSQLQYPPCPAEFLCLLYCTFLSYHTIQFSGCIVGVMKHFILALASHHRTASAF